MEADTSESEFSDLGKEVRTSNKNKIRRKKISKCQNLGRTRSYTNRNPIQSTGCEHFPSVTQHESGLSTSREAESTSTGHSAGTKKPCCIQQGIRSLKEIRKYQSSGETVKSCLFYCGWDSEEWHEVGRHRKEYMQHLFEKYENNMEDNDVVDLAKLEVVTDHGSVRKMRKQQLGCMITYRPLNMSRKKNLASDQKYQATNEDEWTDLSTDISSYSDDEDDSDVYQNQGKKKSLACDQKYQATDEDEWTDLSTDISYSDSEDDSDVYQNQDITAANEKSRTCRIVCEGFYEEENTSDSDPFNELMDRALYVGNPHLYRDKQSASTQDKTTAAGRISSEKNSGIKSVIPVLKKININSSSLSVENFGHSNDSKNSFLNHEVSIDDISMCEYSSSETDHPKIPKSNSFSSFSVDVKRGHKIKKELTCSKNNKFSIDHNQLRLNNIKSNKTASCSVASIDNIKNMHISRVPIDDLCAVKSNDFKNNRRKCCTPSGNKKETGKKKKYYLV